MSVARMVQVRIVIDEVRSVNDVASDLASRGRLSAPPRPTDGEQEACHIWTKDRAAATAPPEGGAAWLATMMLVFATMLLLLSRAVTGAVSRGGKQHAKTPLKATKATTTMLLPAATAVCALAAARCCPLEGAAARGGGPHAETPLKATKATTMLLPAAAAVAAAAEARLRRGVGAGAHTLTPFGVSAGA
ncbi:hypothetical protein T492DRAFT_918914 [Pavlovales sp. CCMP2436]|nr:hypothetical protein T492DRAFT_918914 [Pavlovales sp. CCMP2436]